MGLPIQGQVGPQTLSDGYSAPFRQERTGAQVVQELHGPQYEIAFRKGVYTAFASAVATSVAGTAMVGLQLFNGSQDVNLSLLEAGGMVIVTSATTTSIALASGYQGLIAAPTGQTAATKIVNNFLTTTPAPKGLALNAGTFANACAGFLNLAHNTAAINTVGEGDQFRVDLRGRIIVPPGFYVAIVAVGAAVAASGSNLDLTWEEIPV